MSWYRGLFRTYGLFLMALGFVFFILVYPLGAPVVPWLGLVVALLGAWLGFSPTPNAPQSETGTVKDGDN
ncbi:MAG: hypothetical protein VXW32_08565 [Myxococcota bacterium]|jgi:hypothetical protein|nr:hypothetical protein [Myxococcota bacterium]